MGELIGLIWCRYLANLYLGTAYFEIGDVRSSIGALFSEMDCDLNFRSLIVNDGKNNENDSGWPVIAPKSDQYIYRARGIHFNSK